MRYGDDQERAGRAARAPASARAPARRVSAGPRSRSQSRPRSAASMCEEQQWQQVGTHNGTAWHGHGVMTPHSYDASFNVQHSPPLRSFSPYAPPSHARTQSDWHGGLQQLQLQPMVSPNSRPIPPPPSFPPHQLGMPSPEQAWQAAVADGFNDFLRGYFTDQHRRTMDNSWGPPPPAPQPAQLVPRSASPAQWTTPEANAAHCPSVQLSRARIVADTASPYASSSRRPCSSHDPAYSSHNVRPRLDTTTYNTRTTGSERDRLSSPPPDAATRKRRYVRRLLGPAPADGSEHATRDVEAGPADTVRPKRKYVRRNQPAGAQADKPSTFESPSSAMTTRVTAMSPPRTKRKYVRRARPPESDGDEDSTRTAVYRHDVNRQDGHDVYANPGNRVEPPPRVKRQYIRRVRPAEAAQPADSAGVPADGGARRVAPHGHSIEQPRPQEQRVKRKYIRRVRPLHDEIGDERGLDTAPPRVKRKYVRRTHPSADGGASENSSDRIDLERRRNDVVVRRQQDDSVPRQKRKYTRRVQNVAEEQRQAAGSAAAPPTDQARPRGLNFAMIPLCSDRPRNPEVHSFVSPRYYGINHRVTASALKRIVTTYNSRVDSSLLSISSSGNQHTRDALILADLHTASPPWISTIALDLIRAQRHGIVVAAQQDHDVEVPHSTCIVRGQDGVLSPAASGYEQLLRRQWAVRERGRKWTGSVQSGVSSRRQVNTTALLQAPHILRRNLRGCESAM